MSRECDSIINFADLKYIHFVGVGGAGTAPLAGIMLERGCEVSGSDLKYGERTEKLIKLGARIFKGHNKNNLPDNTQLLVYSSAADSCNPEILAAREQNIPCLRRGEFLAELSKLFVRTVAVSGSHGKTTITAMLVWILRNCGVECNYMVGAKVNGMLEYGTGNSEIFVTEVDESDGTNALVFPDLGIVSNVEDDHSWSVGGTHELMSNFFTFAQKSNKLIFVRDSNSNLLFKDHAEALGVNSDTLMETEGINFEGFMKLNAALACLAAEKLGVDIEAAKNAVNSFPGVARRMTVHFESPEIVVIEDYAHHPTELACAVELLRNKYPQHHLRVVFQPHRYARLAKYIDAFARELNFADSIFLVPVYAAWAERGEFDSESLACRIKKYSVLLDSDWAAMPKVILRDRPDKLLIAVLGAGDIEKLIPELKAKLEN